MKLQWKIKTNVRNDVQCVWHEMIVQRKFNFNFFSFSQFSDWNFRGYWFYFIKIWAFCSFLFAKKIPRAENAIQKKWGARAVRCYCELLLLLLDAKIGITPQSYEFLIKKIEKLYATWQPCQMLFFICVKKQNKKNTSISICTLHSAHRR